MTLPKMIALCGNPLSGKSTVADYLSIAHGYDVLDDGLPLRQIAMDHLGLTENQVFTQEGKLETVDIAGRTFEAREILGEIGNAFEEKFGPSSIPFMAQRRMEPGKRYVMGSVRREQGWFWQKQGALVIEIRRDAAPASKFEFDRFNPDAVQRIIHNNGSLDDLQLCVDAALSAVSR